MFLYIEVAPGWYCLLSFN